ncbi:MAG: hypothetical protein R3B95_11595 [Nitrospirales bacterium]|nr:hypothetical protein [Nitrospirales bacterium]
MGMTTSYRMLIGLAILFVGVVLEFLGYTDVAGELKKIAETLIGKVDGPNE